MQLQTPYRRQAYTLCSHCYKDAHASQDTEITHRIRQAWHVHSAAC